MEKDILEKFWSKVNIKSEDECWEWKFPRGRGKNKYGQFCYKGKMIVSTRFIWSVIYGEIPKGMLICHHCDNPPCVNPKHLFLGTYKDNQQDATKKGRSRNGKSYNHLKRDEHPRAKLNMEKANQIRKIWQEWNGKRGSIVKLSKMFNVSEATINNVVKNRFWT